MTGGLPWWVNTLQQAEAWSVPPWELEGDENYIYWNLRWIAYTIETSRAYRNKSRHG